MEVMNSTQHKKTLASSWEDLTFGILFKVATLPSLLPIILVSAWYIWHVESGETLSAIWYSVILFVLYILSFMGVAWYLQRTYELTKTIMAVLMGFSGFFAGVVIAVVKLTIFFESWAVFRLISEPIFTAIFAGIFGAILLWGKARLPSRSGGGIL